MSRVVLAGAFGQRNPGDDALLEAFLRALDGHDVVATSSTPGALSPRCDTLCDTVASADPADVVRRVRDADAVVFGGGTIFKALRPSTGRPPLDLLGRALALAMGTRALGKPLALVGVGAAPVESRRGRLLARRLVHQADLLVLRDEESADVLAATGAPAPFRVGADAAWTLVGGTPPARPDGEAVVVALSHDAGDGGLADELAAALVPVLAAGFPVVLQPWQLGRLGCRDDLDLARAVNARLGGTATLALPPADLAEASASFGAARLVVGLRFHALIAAAAAGVPFLAYAHEPKLAGLARRLAQRAVVPGGDPGVLGAAIVAAAAAAEPPSAAAVRAQVAAAEEAFALLRIVLAGGRGDEADTLGGLPLRPAAWADADPVGGRFARDAEVSSELRG